MAPKKQSTRDLILAASAERFRKEPVEIAGVDRDLFVRELSAKDMQALVSKIPKSQIDAARKGKDLDESEVSEQGFRSAARFVIATLVNGDGGAVFEEGEEDVDVVMAAFPVSQLLALQTAALRVNRQLEEAGDAKNG
jgi:hypothetical protein